MSQITLAHFLTMCDQAQNESVSWHKAIGHLLDDKEIELAYRAGMIEGARQARKLLELHTDLTLRRG